MSLLVQSEKYQVVHPMQRLVETAPPMPMTVPNGLNAATSRILAKVEQLSAVMSQQGAHPEIEKLMDQLKAEVEKLS